MQALLQAEIRNCPLIGLSSNCSLPTKFRLKSGRKILMPARRPAWHLAAATALIAEWQTRVCATEQQFRNLAKGWHQAVWKDGITDPEYRQRMQNQMEHWMSTHGLTDLSTARDPDAMKTEMCTMLTELQLVTSMVPPEEATKVADVIAAIDNLARTPFTDPGQTQTLYQKYRRVYDPVRAAQPQLQTAAERKAPAPRPPPRNPPRGQKQPPPPPPVAAAQAPPPPVKQAPPPPQQPQKPPETREKQLRDLFAGVKQDCGMLYQIGHPQTFANK
jgi:hypothetical protein